MMDEATKTLVSGLRKAIEAERTGHTFYKMASHNTDDPTGKEVFEQLAREELDHMEFLMAHYRSLVEHGRPSGDVKLKRHGALAEDSPIFSSSLRERIKEAHFEMSALSIAVQLELNAIQHYRVEAKKAHIPEVKKFYEELAEWESSHYNALLRQQEALQDDYWGEAGFHPF